MVYYNISIDDKEKELIDSGYNVLSIDIEQDRSSGKAKFVFNCTHTV